MTTRRTALKILTAAAAAPALPRASFANDLNLSIRVTTPPLNVAPMGVFLEAVLVEPSRSSRQIGRNFPNEYRPDFHETTFVWSLPDEGPVQTPEHLVDAHRRTDRAMGPFVARVFTTPGDHRVSVEAVTADGRKARAEVIVSVDDPARAFSAENTIVVAADGRFDDAPPHDASNAFTDLSEAFARYGAFDTNHVQILLKRGQTFQSPTDQGLRFRQQSAHCHVGAWGSGSRPTIDLAHFDGSLFVLNDRWDGHSLVVRDLHFSGGWDPTTELWKDAHQGAVVATRGNAALLMHNCREEGCAVTVNSRPPRQQTGTRAMTFFNEYDKTDFKDFLLLSPRDEVDVAITGCRVVQNPNALNGGENRGVTSYSLYGRNAHSFIRCSARRLYVASNDIFIRHGWALQKVFDNPAFRINRNDIDDMAVVIARNHIEGMLTRASKRGAVPINMLIEQNYIVSNPTIARAVGVRGGSVSLRNNIILEHNTPKLPQTGSGFQAFVAFNWDGENRTTRDMPNFVYNNSFIMLRSDENAPHGPGPVTNEEGGFRDIRNTNNLLWAPALSSDPTGDGPLETTSLGWDARYRGARLGWARLGRQTLPLQMFPGDTLVVPYWADFFGVQLRQSDFAGQAGRHVMSVRIDGKRQSFEAMTGDAAFAFETNGVRVTNQSATRWPAGTEFWLHCDRGTTPSEMQTQYGHPSGTLALYQPKPQSGAWQTASFDLLAFHDFLGELRPGTAHPDAPQGRPSRGAVEP